MPYKHFKSGGRLERRAGCLHCEVIDAYQAARSAWELRRESGELVPTNVPGAAGGSIACYQLSDEEYAAAFPPPRFKDFLVDMSTRQMDPGDSEDELADEYDVNYESF